jgi:hypothetical protein
MIHRSRRFSTRAGGLLAALLLFAQAAGAQPPADDDAVSRRVADLYKRANALYDQKKLPEAEALYREAWGLRHTWDVATNLGAIEFDLGKPKEAATYFAVALREFPAGGKAAEREQIKARLALARGQVGTLKVRVNVAGASVTVGDREVGKAPVEDDVFVTPGAVTVTAAAMGYEAATQSVQVAKGGTAEVSLVLREPRRSLVPVYVVGGVGAAALVSGAVLLGVGTAKGASAKSQHDAVLNGGGSCVTGALNYDPSCPQISSTASTGDTMHDAGVGLLVGAGVAAAAAVAYAAWPRPKHGAAPSGVVRVAPVVSAGNAALVFSGTF